MTKRFQRRRSVMMTYVLYFLLVLFIPLSIVCVFYVSELNSMLRANLLQRERAHLSEVTAELDACLADIVDSANRISVSNNTYNYTLADHVRYGRTIIGDLRMNMLSVDLASGIYIFSENLPYAYSNTTTYDQDRLVAHLTNGALSTDAFFARMRSYAATMPRIDRYGDRMLLYFPLPMSNAHAETFLAYEIDTAGLAACFRLSTSDMPMFYALYDGEGRILSQNIDIEIPQSVATSADAPPSATGTEMQIGANRYTALTDRVSFADWHIRFLVPEDALVLTLTTFHVRMYAVILIVLVLGNLLVVLFTRRSYAPIRALHDNLAQLSKGLEGVDAAPHDMTNEFESMQNMAENLHASVQELSTMSSMSRIALKQFIILRLLQGAVKDFDVVKDQLSHIGLFMENEYFFVANLHISPPSAAADAILQIPETIEAYDRYTRFLESFPAEDKTLYAVPGPERNQIVLVVCASADDQIKAYRGYIESLHRAFTNEFHLRASIGVGFVYPELRYLPTSYMQSTMALEYRFMQGDNVIAIFTHGQYKQVVDAKSKNLLGFFAKALQDGSAHDVESTLSYIKAFIERGEIRLYEAKYLCQSIVLTASKALYAMPYAPDPSFFVDYNPVRIANMESRDAFLSFLDELCASIGAALDHLAEHGRDPIDAAPARADVVDKLLAFIHEHIGDNQLSIAMLCAHVGFSTSYVSRLFKDAQGETVLEYIVRLRVELAKDLLTSTDRSLESIVQEIGYSDVSSFIRKFKRIVGMTPGEYRKG